MKKYLMGGIAAIALCAAFTSCSKGGDVYDPGAVEQQKKEALEKSIAQVNEQYAVAFEKAFGKVGSNVDWGFGSGKASTRARASELLKEKFTLPSFRGKKDITEPTWPGLPTTLDGKSFYTTWEQVQDAKIPCADEVTSNNNEWTNVYTAYIDADHTNIRSDRSAGRTYYVNGDVKYWNGVSADGATFIVLEGSTLHLGSINHNIKIYLCRNATVDFTKTWEVKTDVISWWPYEATTTITEKDVESVTLEKSNAAIYMSEGSNVKAKTLEVFDGANIYNAGGTIEASYLYIHKNSNLYNNGGEVKVNNGKIYAFDGCEVLVDNGCKVTAKQMDIDKNTTLWNNGEVKVSEDLQGSNENAFIYNASGKTIEAASINLTNNDNLLVNDGTVKVDNEITLQNTDAEIVNNADMECGSFSEAAGAKMYNVGNMTVDGLTHLDNSNSGWQNEGQWTSGSFEIKGTDKGASNNFNNCRLTVHNEFYLNRGAFILDSDAGVECGSFRIDDTSGFYLGNNSVLKIDGTLTTEIINPEYGFFAYGSEYAAVQANSIVTTTNDAESINYYGKLLVAIKPHISQYTAESFVKFTKDNQNIATIPATNCNPGYVGENNQETPTYRVIAEDLNASEASDFDFNDVVFDVEPNEAGTAAKIVVRAAGGIYKLTVAGQEVHAAFGENAKADGLYPMINTQPWNPDVKATLIESYPGDFSSDAAIRNTIKNIVIKVYKPGFEENGIELSAQTGKPACKILVDQTFNVVTERTGIADENTNFHKYVQGIWDTETNGFWWKKN